MKFNRFVYIANMKFCLNFSTHYVEHWRVCYINLISYPSSRPPVRGSTTTATDSRPKKKRNWQRPPSPVRLKICSTQPESKSSVSCTRSIGILVERDLYGEEIRNHELMFRRDSCKESVLGRNYRDSCKREICIERRVNKFSILWPFVLQGNFGKEILEILRIMNFL